VSLRSEIRAAIDEMAPSMGGLPERVVDTVLAEVPRRRRRDRMLFRMRAPLSLVAAIVAIALVAAVLVGGRLIQDWNQLHSSAPAGGVEQTQLTQLEARPLSLPIVSGTAPCPSTARAGVAYGAGPAYGGGPLVSYSSYATAWGDYWDDELLLDANVKGLVLVRALDLRTNQSVVFVGPYGGGATVGTDVIGGKSTKQRGELVLDTGHPQLNEGGIQLMWSFREGLAKGYSACTGWQIDGSDFSETWVASGQ
jgi:hypothetical protein